MHLQQPLSSRSLSRRLCLLHCASQGMQQPSLQEIRIQYVKTLKTIVLHIRKSMRRLCQLLASLNYTFISEKIITEEVYGTTVPVLRRNFTDCTASIGYTITRELLQHFNASTNPRIRDVKSPFFSSHLPQQKLPISSGKDQREIYFIYLWWYSSQEISFPLKLVDSESMSPV